MEMLLFDIGFACYAIAMATYLVYAVNKREGLVHYARWVLFAGAFLHLVSIVMRTYVARHLPDHSLYVPWNNWFESFSFFSLVIALEYLIIKFRTPMPILGAIITPILVGMMAIALKSPSGTQIPLSAPVFQSYWMIMHVPLMFIAYAAFANAFAVGLVYLIQERQIKSKHPSHLAFGLPSLDELDNLIYKIILVSWPILTLGIYMGARWAEEVWGRYWAWDAKETWSFITWLVYTLYIFVRVVAGWRGRKTAYLSLAGFGVIIFTYVGVNYFSQLHGFLGGQ